jgi:hypothetical protein
MHHPNSPFTAKKPDYHASSDDNSDDDDVGKPAPQHKGYVKSAEERALEEHLAKQHAKQLDKVSEASGDSSSDDDDSETPPARRVRSSKEKVLAEKMARRSAKEKKDANKPALRVRGKQLPTTSYRVQKNAEKVASQALYYPSFTTFPRHTLKETWPTYLYIIKAVSSVATNVRQSYSNYIAEKNAEVASWTV